MFTGIIQAVGQIAHVQRFAEDVRFDIQAGTLSLDDVKLGDSIAVNGACLTVVDLKENIFCVDASVHTLEKTTLGKWQHGQKVNLEKCLQLQSYLGGHLVTGHVDGLAQLLEKKVVGRAEELWWRLPQDLLGFVAVKGSIAIDGISLTVNDVQADRMNVTIIPHTNERTTLAEVNVDDWLNIEVDLIARYVARWLQK